MIARVLPLNEWNIKKRAVQGMIAGPAKAGRKGIENNQRIYQGMLSEDSAIDFNL